MLNTLFFFQSQALGLCLGYVHRQRKSHHQGSHLADAPKTWGISDVCGGWRASIYRQGEELAQAGGELYTDGCVAISLAADGFANGADGVHGGEE